MKKQKKVSAIIPAAGQGKRMKSEKSKQLLTIEGKPILAYTLEIFSQEESIDEIIVVVKEEEKEYVEKEIIKRFQIKKVKHVVVGGEERVDSVYNGVKKVSEDISHVLIHDGARPLLPKDKLKCLIEEIEKYDGIILGVQTKDTCKKVDEKGYVMETLSRKSLYNIQTPQIFKEEVIKLAYKKAEGRYTNITDDAMLVEKYTKAKVKLIEGTYENIKITTQEDLHFMEKILKTRRKERR